MHITHSFIAAQATTKFRSSLFKGCVTALDESRYSSLFKTVNVACQRFSFSRLVTSAVWVQRHAARRERNSFACTPCERVNSQNSPVDCFGKRGALGHKGSPFTVPEQNLQPCRAGRARDRAGRYVGAPFSLLVRTNRNCYARSAEPRTRLSRGKIINKKTDTTLLYGMPCLYCFPLKVSQRQFICRKSQPLTLQ